MVRVKICGITQQDDAHKAIKHGAWALGFVFYKQSPRFISPSRARKIIETLPPFVTPVGVFVNGKHGAIKDICDFVRIRTVQFHGDEDQAFCKRFGDYKVIKAFRVDDKFDFRVVEQFRADAYLFDTYQEDIQGGTGKTFNWELLRAKKFNRPMILSGGLNPSNVKDALNLERLFAVDVSSGVEKEPGIKDEELVKSFCEVVRSEIKAD